VVILYGNVPVRPAGLIDRAVNLLVSSNADSVQSYAPVGKFHPWWLARIDPETGMVRPWEGDVLNHGVYRRQDLPPAFVPDGGVLVVTREALMLKIAGLSGPHAFFGREDRRRAVVNSEGAVIDIDSETDLPVADAMLRAQAAATGAPRC
jgi:CMP-N-acetylneuraminic acid synthetase